jgi:hypothetical protein
MNREITDFMTAQDRLRNIMGHPTYPCRRCDLSHNTFKQARDCCYKRRFWYEHEEETNAVRSCQVTNQLDS